MGDSMKAKILTILLGCTIFLNTPLLSMEEVEKIEVVIHKQDPSTPLMHGDRVALELVPHHIPEQPPLPLGWKIAAGVGTGGLCLLTTIGAGAADWGTIIYSNDKGVDSSGAATLGTCAFLGVCTVGLCIGACGKAVFNAFRSRSSQKAAEKFSFEVEDNGSVV
jgi:hypothetical protein